MCALVFIANLAQLADSDGPEVATGVSREIRRRLFAAFPPSGDTDLSCLRDDCFLLRTRHARLDDLLAALGREPILVKGIAAQPLLHADWIALRDSGPMSPAEIELALWAAQPHPAPTARARPAGDVVVDDIEHVYDLRIARQGDALWLRERCLQAPRNGPGSTRCSRSSSPAEMALPSSAHRSPARRRAPDGESPRGAAPSCS